MTFGDPVEITDTVEFTLPPTTTRIYVLPTDDDVIPQSFLQKSVTKESFIEKSFSTPGYAVLSIVTFALVIAALVAAAICFWKSRKYRTSVTFIDSPRDSMPEDPEDPRDCIVTKGMSLFRRPADTEGTNNASSQSGNTSSWRRFMFCCNKPHKGSYENIEDRNLSGGTSAEASDHHEWENGNDHPATLVCNEDEINDPVDMPSVGCNTEPEHICVPHNGDSKVLEGVAEQTEVQSPVKLEPREFSSPKLIKDVEVNNGIAVDKEDVKQKEEFRREIFSPIHILCTPPDELTLEQIKEARRTGSPLANPLCDDRGSDSCSYCDDNGNHEVGSHSSEEQSSVSTNGSPRSASFPDDDRCLRVRFHEE